MAKAFNVAVAGATGAVGQTMIKVLEERDFPVGKIRFLASERSEGKELLFRGEKVRVRKLDHDSFDSIDIAIFSAGGDRSLTFAPSAAKAGAVVVDNSNAWRMDPEIPLVVPEVNQRAVSGYKAKGIIANPNCSTIQMVVALKPLYDYARIKRIIVSTYQAVSGSGKKAIDELKDQVKAWAEGKIPESSVYPHQIAFNCLPHIDVFLDNGYTREEMKMVNETRKIMEDPEIQISATAVRVPVFYSHSEAVNVEFEKEISASKARELFSKAPGIKVVDDLSHNVYPLALDAEGQDLTLVGRIRKDISQANGLDFWVVADNIRKGAATNAVQIAELLAEKYL
ncbi:MAG: aspartate-semialdehyde dehydrogenase [Thermodesulfobacteriota bacterium]|nr:aspartate-semialdehyde dehydrogenase [Thermodesulfobacteriota bacterium]